MLQQQIRPIRSHFQVVFAPEHMGFVSGRHQKSLRMHRTTKRRRDATVVAWRVCTCPPKATCRVGCKRRRAKESKNSNCSIFHWSMFKWLVAGWKTATNCRDVVGSLSLRDGPLEMLDFHRCTIWKRIVGGGFPSVILFSHSDELSSVGCRIGWRVFF